MNKYTEPELTITILDYCKPVETFMLLESIQRHVKFPVKVVLIDNGSNEFYSIDFLINRKLVDQLIINRHSLGLGIGTRDAINVVFSPYFAYIQNDQLFGRDFTYEEFCKIKNELEKPEIKSISLAGSPCGKNIYSERGHIMKTNFYKLMEEKLPLSYFGAGRWHDGIWREEQIQKFYKEHNLLHVTDYPNMIIDNGVFAVRDMGDCGVYCHRTDNKKMWVIVSPKNRNSAYPKVTEDEFLLILNNKWPDGKIPQQEIEHSFDCWSNTPLAKMEEEYINELRKRFSHKKNI